MATVSYDNGLYTPDAWQDTATAEPAWSAAEETTTDWAALATSSTSSSSVAAAAVTTSATSSSAAATTSALTSSSSVLATPSPRSTSSSLVATSSSSSPSQTSSAVSSSLSSSALSASAGPSVAAAAVNSNVATSPKLKQMIPVIVIAPIILGLIIMGLMYGKCWGKRRPSTGEDEDGAGWFGGVGSLGRRRRAIEDEDDALVGGEKYGDDADLDHFDEKTAYAPQRRWSTLMRSGLGRGLSHSSSVGPSRRQRQPTVRVTRPLTDQPFLPPSQSQYDRSFSDSPQRQPYGQRSAPAAAVGLLGGWRAGATRYNSKSSRGSVRSRISERLFGRGGAEEPPSPSCYSPENGAYAGLDGEEEGETKEEDLNEYLAESRMGDSRLARRLLGGETQLAAIPPSTSQRSFTQDEERFAKERYYARHPVVPPPRETTYHDFSESMPSIGMPTPPRPSHVSPTKASVGSALLRPQTSATPPAKLLFSYDSPPVHSTYQAPPYPLISPERAPGSPRGPLPRPPQPQQPAFGQPRGSRQVFPAADSQPDIFFSSQPSHSVGSPMPPFRQHDLQKSDSSYSLSGVQDLVFGTGAVDRPREEIEQGSGAPKQRPISPTKEPAKLQKRKSQPRLPSTATPDRPVRSASCDWNKAELAAESRPPQEPSFNPVFSEPTTIAPLQHPSRVRNAIHNLEAATKATSPPVSPVRQPRQPISHVRTQSNPYTAPYSQPHPATVRPISYPATNSAGPSPQRVTGARATYSRPIKGGSDDEVPSRSASDESDESLRRTKTADSTPSRPLSSDPRRLSQMLRRPSQGGALRPVIVADEE